MPRERTRTHGVSETGHNRDSCSGKIPDRRIQKTEHLLREALASLIAEKPYDSIVIKEILHRANVGRSTFYTHFRDKDDLLVSGICRMVESVRSQNLRRSAIWHERMLWFSLPIFEYHYGHRHDGRLTTGAGTAVQHARLQEVLAEMIADDVRAELKSRRKAAQSMPADLVVEYLASTFVLVLNWWIEAVRPLPPAQIDEVFRALVLPTLAGLRK
ncbi:MAG TPA: TetR/AcrR family transcriptional regulator [Candidatus Baltobacteraceae bacterium]|nr:TetR/AcrR family transcriptional regulator [Candidatus Baltobacteraceae bacterium]